MTWREQRWRNACLRVSAMVGTAAMAAAAAGCGGGGAGSFRVVCSHPPTHAGGADPALTRSGVAVRPYGLKVSYLTRSTSRQAVGTLVPGPAPGATSIATNACSAQTTRTGVVIFVVFKTQRQAQQWYQGSATRWAHLVNMKGIPTTAGGPQRDVVVGFWCRVVGVYENMQSPASASPHPSNLPAKSKDDLLSDPSVGTKVLPPLSVCGVP